MKKEIKNLLGQEMGKKGLESRRRLIDATSYLLSTCSINQLSASDIAKAAGCSNATFYVYFETVLDAVLAAAQRVLMSTPILLDLVKTDWSHPSNIHLIRRFIHEYMTYWRKHSNIFLVRTTLIAEGDSRFMEAEIQSIRPLLLELGGKIENKNSIQAGDPVLPPMTTAASLLAMLERTSAYPPLPENNTFSLASMEEAITAIFCRVFWIT